MGLRLFPPSCCRCPVDFQIRVRSKVCAVTGEPFAPGAACWSVLEMEDGKLVRRDISAEAWEGPPEGCVGHWQTVIPAEAVAAQRKLDADSLFDYFVQLSEQPNNAERDYQYVLALLLMRKRRLILEDSLEIDDRPVMRLIGSAGEGPFDVPETELSDEQIQTLQDQLFGTSPRAAA